MINKKSNLVSAIYSHPESYPPTLNAISELADMFDTIKLLYIPHYIGNWNYPNNVHLIPSISETSFEKYRKSNSLIKFIYFIKYVHRLYQICQKNKPKIILLYDSIPLFAYLIIRPLLFFNHKIWYHNHDINEVHRHNLFSIGRMAFFLEKKYFNKIDIFSIPSSERLKYFPIESFHGKIFTIPNYPSKKIYSKYYLKKKIDKEVNIIFQGRIDSSHGIENIIPILGKLNNILNVKLFLKGSIDQNYKIILQNLAIKFGVVDKLQFFPFSSYKSVPMLASSCHIGIAIFTDTGVMQKTLGTSSNKIYEYAALGLPVIYLNFEHFRRILAKFKWAVPLKDLSEEELLKSIRIILNNYDSMSLQAHLDFTNEYNFENVFSSVSNFIYKIIQN